MIWDVIVIGCGSMGSSALYHGAQRGMRMLGIDKHFPPHNKGSHAGQSRIIRKAYMEHPDYVPLLIRSYDLWRKIEQAYSNKLFHETGLVYYGENGHPFMESIRLSSRLYDIPIEENDKIDKKLLTPELHVKDDFEMIYEPEAGFAHADKTIQALLSLAKDAGATYRFNEEVTQINPHKDSVEVWINNEKLLAKKIICTAGAWTDKLVPSWGKHLHVTQQSLFWFSPKNKDQFLPDNFPCWFVCEKNKQGLFYGFPISEDQEWVKLAYHCPSTTIAPDNKTEEANQKDIKQALAFVAEYFPHSFEKLEESKTCLYTISEDEHFIIDFKDEIDKRIVVASGFSGHGFKFVPVIGEILIDLTEHGESQLPFHFLKKDRFVE